jgi:enoyl-CoA hydratase
VAVIEAERRDGVVDATEADVHLGKATSEIDRGVDACPAAVMVIGGVCEAGRLGGAAPTGRLATGLGEAGGSSLQVPCALRRIQSGLESPDLHTSVNRQGALMSYETVLYQTKEAVATITLNRPERLNTIVPPMPEEVESAVNRAVAEESVKVIVLRGAGRSFCAGYDFAGGFHHWDDAITTDGEWDPGKDFMWATSAGFGATPRFMSLWRSPKPVIAQVHGWCVGGGSDMALCADLIIASEDARIGTPYSRMWGAYLSGMWLYRLGLTRAKEHALTGKPLSGIEAVDVGLVNRAVPFERLEAEVSEQAAQLASIPLSQLAAMKLIVNQAYENMGLASTQTLGLILDGLMRNTPDAKRFVEIAEREGVAAVIAERDGAFGDYSQAPRDQQPDPDHVIEVER